MTLCDRCHAEVHSNKKLYQPLAQRVALLREMNGDKRTTIAQLLS